ncbi:hypothetical protein CEUSTIGMA_g6546.t1 [Chlamydomonas eustigma]|uniref:DUF3067 domain-containing protein n=1 Tax=Chlamydomonas eustigma TaxID=1157962 RepID=A0A250X7S5_9CHLO|nr:hypothetical protein CEUSTIGMA_g6546.t1 [Chlamydomonas eustigma]|eukprot:GAX79106.1 hypothetical protein CEUSTIGMA_g6546.t1 [Chlamydomonas eustigma]
MKCRATSLRSSKFSGLLRSIQSRPQLSARVPHVDIPRALSDSSGFSYSNEGSEDYAAVAARLNNLVHTKARITGREIRELVFEKWGRSYDVRLNKQGHKMYLQVMWKFLEQQSFPLTEEEYMQQLDAVAEYITEWGVVETVKRGITASKSRGPGYNMGGNAMCISIPLDVDMSTARKGEWA